MTIPFTTRRRAEELTRAVRRLFEAATVEAGVMQVQSVSKGPVTPTHGDFLESRNRLLVVRARQPVAAGRTRPLREDPG